MSYFLDPATDPLADGPPPRHALESDDEDEENALSSDQPSSDEQATVEITGTDIPQNLPLIVVSEVAGAYWSKGSTFLGEQIGAILVNSIQVIRSTCTSLCRSLNYLWT